MTTPIPEVEPGRFDCPACPARFEVLGDKKRHIRTDHPKPKNGAS